MSLTKPYLPNSEVVAVAWIRRYVDLGAAGVATSLPNPLPVDGFAQVRSINSGIAAVDLPINSPLITVDTWAAPLASGGKPRWNQAGQIAAVIKQATEPDRQTFCKPLDLGPDYRTPVVLSVTLSTEPRRVEDDPSAYARYTFDLAIDWVTA